MLVVKTVIQQGYRWVVEVDLGSFFDRVNHDRLMVRVARKVEDKRLLKLIRAFLEAGIMADGVVIGKAFELPEIQGRVQ